MALVPATQATLGWPARIFAPTFALAKANAWMKGVYASRASVASIVQLKYAVQGMAIVQCPARAYATRGGWARRVLSL